MKFLVITLIAAISAAIGLLIVGGVFGEEWFARFYRIAAVAVVVAVLCFVGLVTRILRKPTDDDDATTDELEAIIAQVYEEGQSQCTPSVQPQVDYIIWDRRPRRPGPEHQNAGDCGAGRIVDANTGLRGSFQVCWSDGSPGLPGATRVPADPNGFWDILLEI